MPWTLQQYEDNRGMRPVGDFVESLTESDRAIVSEARLLNSTEASN